MQSTAFKKRLPILLCQNIIESLTCNSHVDVGRKNSSHLAILPRCGQAHPSRGGAMAGMIKDRSWSW